MTDQSIPAVWVDGDPLMEKIAAAVWEQCQQHDSGLVVDDPRNIAAVAATVARTHAASAAVVPAADRAAPVHWIDGHPQLEAMAAAVWERCEHHDSGLIIDDPRNIAVAALAAVLPAPADRAAVLREAADRLVEEIQRGARFGHEDACHAGLCEAVMLVRRWAVESAVVDRVAAETPPAEMPRCVNCGLEIENRGDPDMGGQHEIRWVHVPGGYTICFPQQPSSPRATPGPVVPAQPGNDTNTPVAYRSPGGLYLYCTRHSDDVGASWTPLDSDDLPDGGLCAKCGADVLITP